MKLTYFDFPKTSHLVEEFFVLSYSEKVVPLEAVIIPLGLAGMIYIYSNGQNVFFNNTKKNIKGLILNGQFYKSYNLEVLEPGFISGISFKPTTLHKLTNLDVSTLCNKHSSFDKINPELANKFENIFINHDNNFTKLFNNIENLITELPLIENKNTIAIDTVINFIHLKEGMLSVSELLDKVPFGQKTLETQFKKMVGLTPSKYIRIHRFKKLMKQYESYKIDLKDLIYMYDYYDESHFAKDFKDFTSKSFKEYFKSEFLLIKEILKNSRYDFLQD